MRLILAVIGLTLVTDSAGAQESPKAALEAFKKAVDSGDVRALADRTADVRDDKGEKVVQPLGTAFREVAGPYVLAKEASDRLDATLRANADAKNPEKAGNFRNPFVGSFNAFSDLTCEIVEEPTPLPSKEAGRMIARIKFGPRGQNPEEPVFVQLEAGKWRVVPPVELAKSIQKLARDDIRKKRVDGYTKLAKVLDEVAGGIEKGTLKTKDDVTLDLIRRFQKENLATLLQ